MKIDIYGENHHLKVENIRLKSDNQKLELRIKELEEQLRLGGVSTMLPSINSNTFKNYLEANGYTETLNPLAYKKQGFEYDKEVLYRHFLNEIEFEN